MRMVTLKKSSTIITTAILALLVALVLPYTILTLSTVADNFCNFPSFDINKETLTSLLLGWLSKFSRTFFSTTSTTLATSAPASSLTPTVSTFPTSTLSSSPASTVLSNLITSKMAAEATSSTSINHKSTTTTTSAHSKTPVYYFSHGGPTFMYQNEFGSNKGAFNVVKQVGNHIKNIVKPKYIVVISGHWQSSSSARSVNGNGKSAMFEIGIPDDSTMSGIDKDGHEDHGGSSSLFDLTKSSNNANDSKMMKLDPKEHSLIYDFYGFPDHMYRERFHVKGSSSIANSIQKQLAKHNLSSKVTKRGLDHGVWVPLKVAFGAPGKLDSQQWDLPPNCPLVQISLASGGSRLFEEDFDVHYKLGEALSELRNQGALIITSGASVHNLGDIGLAMHSGAKAMPYAVKFNDMLTEIISKYKGNDRLKQFNLLKEIASNQVLLRKAHPTLDHLMPVVVGAGAASEKFGKEIYSDAEYSLGWNIYQWD